MKADFDGATYDARLDRVRLGAQHQRVWDLMRDGEWRTLADIAKLTGSPEASVSARLRDFRKPKFGGHTVERRRIGDRVSGWYEYRVAVNQTQLSFSELSNRLNDFWEASEASKER